ncbi:hypothetical protein PpBr36_04407 [Pyricularia pennisetigena]|uniref:hypothetical protein n=1 Tax=Pyricularia pennisetigena TaxID=1578925 RepID=UPI00114D7229|nr:hypothetical protein PpBr36_04407 [Pyricularia pennisetigena]TLS26470.1 hypothetical protein PpBr36_04407 [Pyricularia pennisetigena]
MLVTTAIRPSFGRLVLPHEMHRKCRTVHHTLEVDVDAHSVWDRWKNVYRHMAPAEVVLGVTAKAACVGHKVVQTTLAGPDDTKRDSLLFARGYIALNEHGRFSRGVGVAYGMLRLGYTAGGYGYPVAFSMQ